MKGQLHNEEKPHYMNFSLFVFLHKKKRGPTQNEGTSEGKTSLINIQIFHKTATIV